MLQKLSRIFAVICDLIDETLYGDLLRERRYHELAIQAIHAERNLADWPVPVDLTPGAEAELGKPGEMEASSC